MNNTRILINNLKIFQGINQNVTNIFSYSVWHIAANYIS